MNQRILLIGIALFALVSLYKMYFSLFPGFLTNFSFAMLFAGILGNLVDRVFLGYVRDFLSFQFFGYSYPIFNLADVFIVLGAIFMIIVVVRSEKFGTTYRNRNKR